MPTEKITPASILDLAYGTANKNLETPLVSSNLSAKVEYISRNIKNRAGIRLLMTCLPAKIHNSSVDVRKPYTEIGTLING